MNFKYYYQKIKELFYKDLSKSFLVILFVILILSLLTPINNNNNKYNKPLKEQKYVEEKEQEIIELPKITYHVSLEAENSSYNYYAPVSGHSGYRYGPSIILNEDGSLDGFFSSPGNNKEWDWITYSHSDDGTRWSKEKIVLQPTANSMDHYSICDPAAIYFNGYYYLGYTSTIVATNSGICNNVFVARSKNVDGPYEKWNGNGWGGDPEPIIYYNEADNFWGAGNVSFVIANDTLYCYYTWDCEHGNSVRVSTAKLVENWPSTLEYKGIAYNEMGGQDGADATYLEDYNKFVIFSTVDRFTSESGIAVMESDDGISYRKSDIIKSNFSAYAHNMGISKGLDGHIREDDDLRIGYAFTNRENNWGRWATRIQKINLIVYEGDKKHFDEDGLSYRNDNCYVSNINPYYVGIGLESKIINVNEGKSATINPYAYTQNRLKSYLKSKVTYEYDEEALTIKGNTITGLKEGEYEVKMYYGDFYSTFKVIVNEKDYSLKNIEKEIITFEPVEENITLHIENNNYHSVQIRAYVKFNTGEWGEAYNDRTSDHPKTPAMIDGEEYQIDYEVEDEKIVEVSENGILEPLRVGETRVKVTVNDDKYFYVNVKVEF